MLGNQEAILPETRKGRTALPVHVDRERIIALVIIALVTIVRMTIAQVITALVIIVQMIIARVTIARMITLADEVAERIKEMVKKTVREEVKTDQDLPAEKDFLSPDLNQRLETGQPIR